MKLLITGACGHIGSALIRRRSMRDYDEVILLDDMSAERYCSLFNIMGNANFRFVQGSVCDRGLVNSLIARVDTVVHLAAKTNASASVDDLAATWHTNFWGTQLVAWSCQTYDRSLLFPSTTSVYGRSKDVVSEVGYCDPQSPYAESKLKAERCVLEGEKSVVLRFGTIAGHSIGMRFHTAVNKFIWQACTDQPLTIWRTAWDQVRPYLSLDDCLRAIEFVMMYEMFESNLYAKNLYNVVTENHALSRIVQAIEHRLGRVVERELVDSPIMNQLSYEVSAAKIEEEGFEFQGNLYRDIADTIDALRGLT